MGCLYWCVLSTYFPSGNIHAYLRLTATSVKGMHRLKHQRWKLPLTCLTSSDSPHRSCCHSLAQPRWPPSLQRKQMQTSSTLFASPGRTEAQEPTQRSPSDSCPDFLWHQSQSSVTLMPSRSEPMADGLFIPEPPYLSPSHKPWILNWQQHILKQNHSKEQLLFQPTWINCWDWIIMERP